MPRFTDHPRAILLALLAAVSISWAFAQSPGLPPPEEGAKARLNASPRHGEWVSYDAGTPAKPDKVNAFIVYPEVANPAPVVLLVHEIYGLTDWVRSVADQLAAEGFIAIAPDLLSGKGPGGKGSSGVDADGARALIGALDPAEVTRRLDATANYALALPAAAKRFGILGFCWGGGISLGYATTRQDLGASVAFYGVAPPASGLAKVKAPVLALYGGSDARVTSTEAPAAAEMKRLGKRFDYEIYDGAGHAFLRQQGAMNGANQAAANKAWPRTVAFLKETLGVGGASYAKPSALLASALDAAPAPFQVADVDTDGCDGICCAVGGAASAGSAVSL